MCEFLDGEDEIIQHGDKLPHWQQGEVMQFVTFRLGDAMPAAKLEIWREQRDIWKDVHPEPWNDKTKKKYHKKFSARLEEWLDQGYGSCLLRDSENRRALENVFVYDEGSRVNHHAWVIMPNHVHLLFSPKHPLPKLISSWKSISARRIGKGSIWQRNYRDTLIRDSQHFANAVRYIRKNPRGMNSDSYTLWESERAKEIL